MNRPVSIKQVAAEAGVSLATVSNVLNRPDVVAAPTRDRVLTTMRELGFVRNESARMLRAGRSRLVGLIVFDIGNPFFTDIAKSAERALASHDLALVLCDSDKDPDKERHYLELLEQQRVHGILIAPTDSAEKHIQEVRRRGTPVVLVDRVDKLSHGSSVAVDDIDGGRQVMQHLQAMGHDRVSFVGGPFTLMQVRDRHSGMAREGIVSIHETRDLDLAEGRAAAAALLRQPARSRPTAVACANDLLALGVLQHLTEHGMRVPQDIALVGYDDIDFAAAASIPLTSVRQPRSELGRTAVDYLMAPDGKNRSQLLRPELVIRRSTDHRRRRRVDAASV